MVYIARERRNRTGRQRVNHIGRFDARFERWTERVCHVLRVQALQDTGREGRGSIMVFGCVRVRTDCTFASSPRVRVLLLHWGFR